MRAAMTDTRLNGRSARIVASIVKPSFATLAATEYRQESIHRTRFPDMTSLSDDNFAPQVNLIQGSMIAPKSMDWLWNQWLARGKMHIIAGAPGGGKTTIAQSFAAIVSSGGTWPDGSSVSAGNVVIWSGEDDPTDTLVPRLIVAGANMSRIFFVGQTIEKGKARSFNPGKDIEPLEQAIASAGGVTLMIVDPIVSAVLGDSHKNGEVRRSLQPLVDLAAKTGAALVGISHLSKGTQGREPTERITGSLAFAALARVVLIAAKLPSENADDPPARIFMRSKSNIGCDSGGYEYSLVQEDLAEYPGLSASLIKWGTPIVGSARDLLAEIEAPREREARNAKSVAMVYLTALLKDGPMSADDVKTYTTSAGLSWATVRRAQSDLGIVPIREGFSTNGQWRWALPDHRCST
jgi:putative DNA primase/helicase